MISNVYVAYLASVSNIAFSGHFGICQLERRKKMKTNWLG